MVLAGATVSMTDTDDMVEIKRQLIEYWKESQNDLLSIGKFTGAEREMVEKAAYKYLRTIFDLGCNWVYSEEGYYKTSCGLTWHFPEGGCEQNGVIYCPRCGKVILELIMRHPD